jgi:hypothetical protein
MLACMHIYTFIDIIKAYDFSLAGENVSTVYG